MKKRYYIAYGSNLNLIQMSERCPGAEVVGTGELKDYMLEFKGSRTGSYLTITPAANKSVPIVVWKVSKQHEKALDHYEGFPVFYYKAEKTVTIYNFEKGKTETVDAFVYIMHEDRPLGIPSKHYMETCKDGYKLFGFDESILKAAYHRSLNAYSRPSKPKICPKCGQSYQAPSALSRLDNKTFICPDCGTREALNSLGINETEQEEIIKRIHNEAYQTDQGF